LHIGHYISGVAHAAFVAWAMFGGVFVPEPPAMEVTPVSMITTEEFDRLLAAERAPTLETEIAMPRPPEAQDAPQATSQPDRAPTPLAPSEIDPGAPDATPDAVSAAPTPLPPQDLAPAPPDIPEPPADAPPVAAQPEESRPARRVASVPVAPRPPDTTIDETIRNATRPDEEGPRDDPDEQEATAPEEATTEIVTEPKQAERLAPRTSLRPRARPARPVARADEPIEQPGTDAAVEAALAEATEDTPAAAPSGPPLTASERDGLRIAVQGCWVVDVGSRAANVTVVLGLSLDRDGKVTGDIRLIRAEGGTDSAVRAAFDAARRAVLRCQRGGYKLPIDKYDHWREIEMTFNPEKMRGR
jgi:hypothetical protein